MASEARTGSARRGEGGVWGSARENASVSVIESYSNMCKMRTCRLLLCKGSINATCCYHCYYLLLIIVLPTGKDPRCLDLPSPGVNRGRLESYQCYGNVLGCPSPTEGLPTPGGLLSPDIVTQVLRPTSPSQEWSGALLASLSGGQWPTGLPLSTSDLAKLDGPVGHAET